MPYSFTVDFVGNAQSMFDQAIAKKAPLVGTASAGTFSALGVTGSYQVARQQISILIYSKPWYLPMKLIESKVREFFANPII
jgi:hypothetical protein